MNVFEKMWKEMVQRLAYANVYSVNKNLSYQDMINLMAAYEKEFEEEIGLENEMDKMKEADEKKAAKKDKK